MKKAIVVLSVFLFFFLTACAGTTITATPTPTNTIPGQTTTPTNVPTSGPIIPTPPPEPTSRQPYYYYEDYGLPPECSCFINAAWPSGKPIWQEIFYPKTNWIPLENCRVLGDNEIVYWPWSEDDPAESCIIINDFVSISRRGGPARIGLSPKATAGGYLLFFRHNFQSLNPACNCYPASLRVGGRVIVVTEDGLYFSPAIETTP